MAKPPLGRILRDVREPAYIAEQERLQREMFTGPVMPDEGTLWRLEQERWFRETPEGRAEGRSVREAVRLFVEDERHTAALAEANRETRMLNGEPASIEPRSIHPNIPDPQWKRKLRPQWPTKPRSATARSFSTLPSPKPRTVPR